MMEPVTQVADALAGPFVDPGSRTFWWGLVSAVVIAAAWHAWRNTRVTLRSVVRAVVPAEVYTHRSNLLDVQLYAGRRLLGLLLASLAPGVSWLLATRLARELDARFGVPETSAVPPLVASVLFTVVLFVAWDASRWVVHWLMHVVPPLWAFHQVHHSAEVLTPLTFHRIHPLESVLYQVRGALVTGLLGAVFFWLFRGRAADITLLGVHGIGLVLNVAHGNLRHSHVWIGFGPTIERWFISPAQHQMHHADDPALYGCNYGTWLAIWDRVAGSLRLSGATPPESFGIPEAERNHGNDLVSAWFGPIAAVVRRPWLALVLLAAFPARAQDDAENPDEIVPDLQIIVYAEDGTPRVAGSAHSIDEEELEQFEYDDIHRVLDDVPGVYVREEDGFGLRPNIGIRGANSDRSAKVTLLEDGVPFAPAPYAAPAAYYFPMSTRLVGVEVYKGPAAIQHGPQTIGGAVNLITRSVPHGADGAFDLAVGLRDTHKVHSWVGAGNDRAGVLVEGVRVSSGGFKDLDGGGPTGFARREGMLKARFGSDPALRTWSSVELKLGLATEVSHETYLGLSVQDYETSPYRRYAASSEALMTWHRGQAELAWDLAVGSDFEARAVAYYHELNRVWTKFNRFAGGPSVYDMLQQPEGGQSAVFLAILRGEEDSVSDDQQLMIGTNDRRFQSGGVQTRARWRAGDDDLSSQLEAGLRLHYDDVYRLQTEDPFEMQQGVLVPGDAPELTLTDSRAQALALAAHVQEDLGIQRWHVLPGARLESVWTERAEVGEGEAPRIHRLVVLPGLGTLVEVTRGLSAFGGLYRGFSPVPPGEPEEVKPELAWNWEAGVRVSNGDQTRAEVVGFFNDYSNLTGQCTLSGGCTGDQLDLQFNGGEVDVYGLEAVAGHEIGLPERLSLSLDGSWTWTRSSFRTGFVSSFPQWEAVEVGDRLTYVPEHQGSIGAALAHPRFSIGANVNARTGMDDVAGGGPPEDPAIPSLVLLDLAADAQLTDHLRLYATATNVTGSDAIVSWRPFGARPTAPFQLMVGVKMQR